MVSAANPATSTVKNRSFIQRMEDEASQLNKKIQDLEKFINGDQFEPLTTEARSLLMVQFSAMRTYQQILQMRIKLYK